MPRTGHDHVTRCVDPASRTLPRLTRPAIFLLGIITLVFGIDMAMRALKAERFAPKGKWTTTICIGFIAFLALMMWMPTIIWPMYNRCFGSLIWFPMRYELLMIVVIVILIGMFLILAAIISIQLMRTSEVDPNQRIAASWMCYYLILSALLYVRFSPGRIETRTNGFYRHWYYPWKCKLTDRTLTAHTLRQESPRSPCSAPASLSLSSICSSVSTPRAWSSSP